MGAYSTKAAISEKKESLKFAKDSYDVKYREFEMAKSTSGGMMTADTYRTHEADVNSARQLLETEETALKALKDKDKKVWGRWRAALLFIASLLSGAATIIHILGEGWSWKDASMWLIFVSSFLSGAVYLASIAGPKIVREYLNSLRLL